MKRMIAAVTALAVGAIAAPVGASEPIGGTVSMSANPGSADGTGPCPDVNWAGSLVLEGTDGVDGTYGLVLTYNDVEGVMRGPWYLFQENWAVTSEVPEFDADGMPIACFPGEVLMSGWDAGVGAMETAEFWDTGFVEEAAPPFEAWLGARTYQDGIMSMITLDDGTPVPVQYEGTFRLE